MKRYKGILIRFGMAVFLFALCFLMTAFARNHAEWITTYFTPYSKTISGFLGKIFSVIPFISLGELLLYALIISAVVLLVLSLFKRRFFTYLSWLALTAGGLAFFFVSVWGLNYYDLPLADTLGIPVSEYSEAELFAATQYYMEKTNEYSLLVSRNEKGVFDAGGYKVITQGTAACFENLSKEYPRFIASYSNPKAVSADFILSYSGITGIYNPFTGEANVNPDTPDINMGYVLCHEMAHRLCVAPENEANYVAFIACCASDDPAFLYSGYYTAFVFCFNRLTDEDRDKLYPQINDSVYTDMEDVRDHYDKFEGPAKEVADKVNDTYLKTLDQEEGTQSYGEVVDLMIAHYLTKIAVD